LRYFTFKNRLSSNTVNVHYGQQNGYTNKEKVNVDVNRALNMVCDKASRVNVVIHVGKTSSAGILLAVEFCWHQKFENVNSVLEKCEDDINYHSSPRREVVPEKELWWNMRLKIILDFGKKICIFTRTNI